MSYRLKSCLLVAGIVIIVLVMLFSGFARLATKTDVTMTVDRREVKNYVDESKYLVWATKDDGQTEVFESTDDILVWKFNSSDVYGQLKEGKTFKVRVMGWRAPFLS